MPGKRCRFRVTEQAIDLFVGDSRTFAISYLFVGKWARDFVHWIMVGEGLRQPFVDEVLLQGMLGAAYAAAVGIVLLTVTGIARDS